MTHHFSSHFHLPCCWEATHENKNDGILQPGLRPFIVDIIRYVALIVLDLSLFCKPGFSSTCISAVWPLIVVVGFSPNRSQLLLSGTGELVFWRGFASNALFAPTCNFFYQFFCLPCWWDAICGNDNGWFSSNPFIIGIIHDCGMCIYWAEREEGQTN